MFGWFTAGELKSEGESITEGIGQGRVTANLEGLRVDHAWQVSDVEAVQQVFDLAEHEGLLVGGSAGVNVAGAVRMARELGPGKTVVVLGTAHPAKFPDAVARATGRRPALPAHLADLLDRPERFTVLPNAVEAVEGFIADRVRADGAAA